MWTTDQMATSPREFGLRLSQPGGMAMIKMMSRTKASGMHRIGAFLLGRGRSVDRSAQVRRGAARRELRPATAGTFGMWALKKRSSMLNQWAQFGKQPDTNKLIDTTIAVIAVAYPPAGIVLGVAKGFVTAVSAGPDPVGEAINRINQQLVAANARMDGLQHQVDVLKDVSFRTANNTRLYELKRRKDTIEQIRDDLRARPTDPAAKSKFARDALRIADRFLRPGLATRRISGTGATGCACTPTPSTLAS